MMAVRRGGPVRQIAPAPASVIVEDVRPDGRTLLQTTSLRTRIVVKTPANTDEQDLSWFDYGLLSDMSADGSTILFNEQGEGGGPNHSVFVRRTDGAPAVRLADGYSRRLSPDLQSALTGSLSQPSNVLTIMPIGPGEARKVVIPLQTTSGIRWFPDGKWLAVGKRARASQPVRVHDCVGQAATADARGHRRHARIARRPAADRGNGRQVDGVAR